MHLSIFDNKHSIRHRTAWTSGCLQRFHLAQYPMQDDAKGKDDVMTCVQLQPDRSLRAPVGPMGQMM